MKRVLILLVGCGALVGHGQAQTALPLTNPAFEEGKSGWTDDKGASEVVAEAAHAGRGGLRVNDTDAVNYVRVISEAVPVIPGKTYQLNFVARQVSGHGVNGILWFLDDEGELIQAADGSRLWVGPPEDDNTEWQEFSVSGIAPKNAVSAQIYVQSNRAAIGVIDFDNFRLEQVD